MRKLDFSDFFVILLAQHQRPKPTTPLSNETTYVQQPKFHVASQARFGRAPRILPNVSLKRTAPSPRSEVQRDFESSFTRTAHLQRFRAVRDALLQLGEVHQRTCRNYATFSDSHGNQFAVVKPLSDGGLRIGLGDFESISNRGLEPASGVGSSSRINYQFELDGHHALSGTQLGLLRRAYQACEVSS